LGDRLEKVILFGSYARGDYDDESDVDIMIIADIAPEDKNKIRDKIRDLAGDFLWDYNILVSLIITSRAIYYRYLEASGFYKNVRKEGVELYAA